MYIVIDLEKDKAGAYKDKNIAAKQAKCSYSTLHRHLERSGYYKKGNIRVYIAELTKSKRGNPHLKR